MEIKGLKFVMTCGACPEQYDVFDKNGKMVGYVRLRWGGLTCEYPDVFGEIIYQAAIGDGWTGEFENEEQRMYHLNMIADKILEKEQTMGRKFKIDRDIYGEGIKMYKKSTIEINPGITVLVGCNGIGKTTLLKQLYHKVQKENIPCVMFDNLKDGGDRARSKAGFYGDITFIATSLCSSEGENIGLNMQNFSKMIGSMFRNNPKDKEYWIFADAVDSGFSIDNIVDLKEGLFDLILDYHKDKEIYIVVTANAYEMARNEQCFDVVHGKYISIKSYEKYRSVVLRSKEEKNKIHGAEKV